MNSYNPNDIELVQGMAHIRLRMEMYLGSRGQSGLNTSFYEIFSNSVDEFLAGKCTTIQVKVTNNNGTVEVQDNGRGIPWGINDKTGRSALDLVIEEVGGGGKFSDGAYESSGGLHGIGLSAVNAVSSHLIATVERDGYQVRKEYSQGKATTDLIKVKESKRTGTSIKFTPDPEIFEVLEFDTEYIKNRCKQSAYLNKGLRIEYINESENVTFFYENGIADYIIDLTKTKTEKIPKEPIYIYSKVNKVAVEIAFAYCEDDGESILSFTNNINNPDGGTHLTGFRSALTRIVNNFAKTNNLIKEKQPNFSGDDVRDGIIGVISIRMPQPKFEGQTKNKLTSTEIESIVSGVLTESLNAYFDKNPAIAKLIIQKAMIAQQAREAKNKISNEIKRKTVLNKSASLSRKLLDCSSKNPDECELYICEGDSAAGSISGARNPRIHAVLPIRGKIINTEKNELDKLLKNQEVQDIISAIGGTIGKNGISFDVNKLRYSKIIICTDADIDGLHIICLLLTLFYNFGQNLITNGNLFILNTPLFCIIDGKNRYYAMDNEASKSIMKAHPNGKKIRFKGIGEWDASDFKINAMDVSNRLLTKVGLDNLDGAENIMNILMGDLTDLRKSHIINRSVELSEYNDAENN